jgi:hypothetical protein
VFEQIFPTELKEPTQIAAGFAAVLSVTLQAQRRWLFASVSPTAKSLNGSSLIFRLSRQKLLAIVH